MSGSSKTTGGKGMGTIVIASSEEPTRSPGAAGAAEHPVRARAREGTASAARPAIEDFIGELSSFITAREHACAADERVCSSRAKGIAPRARRGIADFQGGC